MNHVISPLQAPQPTPQRKLTLSWRAYHETIQLRRPWAIAADKADLLDINTATAEQLKVFRGIGDAYTEKIIKGRPYAQNDELVQKKILPRVTYEGIKYKITAKQK